MTKKLLDLLEANRGRGAAAFIRPGLSPAAYDPDKDGDSDKPGVPDTDEATIYVYDVIGGYWGGVDAATLAPQIAALTAKTIHLRINSPGGAIDDARAIKTALENHGAKVIAYVDGMAASSASFLMLAADEIVIAEGAFVMIHNPWTFAMGDAGDMRAQADILDKYAAAIARDYSKKTGLPEAECRALMDAETWLESHEALAKGFVDRIAEKATKASALAHTFNLAAYAHAPKALTEPAASPSPDLEADDAALLANRERQRQLLNLYERTAPAAA